MNTDEILGSWWLANSPSGGADWEPPERYVSGVFTHGDSRPWQLTTIGSVASANSHVTKDPQRENSIATIWGAGVDGRRWSLLGGALRGLSWDFLNPWGGTETYAVDWYGVGPVWADRTDEASNVYIELDGLEQWAHGDGAQFDYYPELDSQVFKPPPLLEQSVDLDDVALTLIVGNSRRSSQHEYVSERSARFKISKSVPLGSVRDKWVNPLRLMLDLLTGDLTNVTDVRAVLPDEDRHLELCFNFVESSADYDKVVSANLRGMGQHRFVAPLKSFTDQGVDFPTLIGKFWELYRSESHNAALWYLRNSGSPALNKTTASRLLGLFKAVECYHREEFDQDSEPENTYRERLTAVRDSIPEQHRRWAMEKLSGRNKKGARTILKDVKGNAGHTYDRIEAVWPNLFAEAVAWRARVAHGSPAAETRPYSIENHAGAIGLRWLLRHVYLAKLGLASGDVDQMFEGNPRFVNDMMLLRNLKAHHG